MKGAATTWIRTGCIRTCGTTATEKVETRPTRIGGTNNSTTETKTATAWVGASAWMGATRDTKKKLFIALMG